MDVLSHSFAPASQQETEKALQNPGRPAYNLCDSSAVRYTDYLKNLEQIKWTSFCCLAHWQPG